MLETVYSTASKGSTEYGLKVIEIARTNTNAAFDFVEELFGVKSPSELVELSTAHARTQFETLTAQGKELPRWRRRSRPRPPSRSRPASARR